MVWCPIELPHIKKNKIFIDIVHKQFGEKFYTGKIDTHVVFPKDNDF
jgi:hypothetical protein